MLFWVVFYKPILTLLPALVCVYFLTNYFNSSFMSLIFVCSISSIIYISSILFYGLDVGEKKIVFSAFDKIKAKFIVKN